MNLPSLRRRKRAWPNLTLDTWINQFYDGSFGYGGSQYPILGTSMGVNPQEEPPNNYYGYVGYLQQAYRSNGVVFACMLARMMHFSAARFMAQEINNGRPGDLVDAPDLEILRNPWPNGQTGDMLARAIQDVDIAGNSFTARKDNRLFRLRPDWVTIIMGSNTSAETPAYAWDCEVIGYYYCPPSAPDLEMAFLPQEVAHWAPIPDPAANFRGHSWLSAVMKEMIADNAMTYHQRKYFEQGATPSYVVTLDPSIPEANFQRWVTLMKENAEGVENAYKIMWLGAGAEPHSVGSDLQTFTEVKGHGETRMASAAGVPPILAGLSEGLASATYSNYGQARRHFGDSTCRWLWDTYAASMNPLVKLPPQSRLAPDLRDVAFLREDHTDAAQIGQTEASTIRTLIDAGFEPESVKSAVLARDWTLLKHTGLFSVQLQPPMTSFKQQKPASMPVGGGNGANGVLLPGAAEIIAAGRGMQRSLDNGNGNGKH